MIRKLKQIRLNKVCILLILFFVIVGCGDSNSITVEMKTVDCLSFSIKTNKGFRYIEKEGIDSQVGLITNEKDTFHVEYGLYSNDFFDKTDLLYSGIKIDGITAAFVKSKLKQNSFIGLYIDNVYKNNSLHVMVDNVKNYDEVLNVLKSIQFYRKNINNKHEDYDGSKNYERKDFPLGYFVFKESCFSCHDVKKRKVGPALNGFSSDKLKMWLTHNRDNSRDVSEFNKEWHMEKFDLNQIQISNLCIFIERHK